MIIFVTGASGYLGSHLVKALSKEHSVFALMRRSSLKQRIKDVSVNIIYVDDFEVLENAFAQHQPDIIINTAALYGRKGESLSALIDANIDFPAKLLGLAERHKSKIFINTGTSLPDDISPYALTKNTFTKLAQFNVNSTLKFVNIALEHFYGPEDDCSKFISYVINTCLSGENLALTSGLQQRDFIYIKDVISAYQVIIENLAKLGRFENISVGSGVAPTIRELVEMIHVFSNSKSTLEFGAVAMRTNELMYSCADTRRLKELNWRAVYSLESGIKATLKGKE